MLSLDDNLRLVYELKEEYRNFNSSATILNAEEWLDEIINSFNRLNDHRISNEPMERVNRDIKTIIEISFGSTNFTRVRNRVIFSISDSSPILYHRKSSSNKKSEILEENTKMIRINNLESVKKEWISLIPLRFFRVPFHFLLRIYFN